MAITVRSNEPDFESGAYWMYPDRCKVANNPNHEPLFEQLAYLLKDLKKFRNKCLTAKPKSLKCAPLASVAELVDAPDSKSGALKACRFESDHWHQIRKGLQKCKPFFIASNFYINLPKYAYKLSLFKTPHKSALPYFNFSATQYSGVTIGHPCSLVNPITTMRPGAIVDLTVFQARTY